MSKRHRLKGLRLDELSLVDRPANSQSKIALYKRGDNTMTDANKAMHGDNSDMSDTEKSRMRELMDKENMSEKDARAQVMRERTDKNAGSPGGNPSDNEGDNMSEDTKKELGDLKEQVGQLTKQLEAVQSQVEEHGLSVTKKDDGSLKVEKKADEEYVEFNGEKVAKSALPAPVLKHLEQQNEELRKMKERQEAEDLRKRADQEIPNLKGSADERGALLKAVDGISDEATRKSVIETLKAADGFAKNAFSEIGKSAADDESSATARLNKMADEHAKENNKTFEQAYADVTKDGEGARLFNESRREQKAN